MASDQDDLDDLLIGLVAELDQSSEPTPEHSNRITVTTGNRGTGASVVTIPQDEVEGFLFFGDTLSVSSSNVASARYDNKKKELHVYFLGNRQGYAYTNVGLAEALSFAQAGSKGKYIFWNFKKNKRAFYRLPY